MKILNIVFLRRSVQVLQSILVTYLVISKFTSVTQGYYYVYLSVFAMQLFFEAGIGGIINKYVLKSTAIQSAKSELWKFFEISSTLFACTTILSTVILMFVLLSFISSSDMMTKIWLTLTVFFNGIYTV